MEFCLEGKGYPIGLLLSSQGSGFIQALQAFGGKFAGYAWRKRKSQRKCGEARVLSCFPVQQQPGQDKNTWEVAVHEPAGRLYLLRLA